MANIEEINAKKSITNLINGAENIAIIPSKIAGLDAYSAGVGLYYMLKEVKSNVSIIYPGKIPEGVQDLLKPSEITSDVKQRSLLVSVDYSGTDAAKVHYSTENDVLYLKISPVPFDYNKDEKIKTRVTGFDFDVIFVIGAQTLLDLGNTYKNLDTVSKISKIINLDITAKNEGFGFINIIDADVNTLSLLILQNATQWGLKLNETSAKALLKGIVAKESPFRG